MCLGADRFRSVSALKEPDLLWIRNPTCVTSRFFWTAVIKITSKCRPDALSPVCRTPPTRCSSSDRSRAPHRDPALPSLGDAPRKLESSSLRISWGNLWVRYTLYKKLCCLCLSTGIASRVLDKSPYNSIAVIC